jgi:hypothetical protein
MNCSPEHWLKSPARVSAGTPHRTHKEYVKVCQRKPGEEQIQPIVHKLQHEGQLANQRVTRTPDLRDVDKRIDRGEERSVQPPD